MLPGCRHGRVGSWLEGSQLSNHKSLVEGVRIQETKSVSVSRSSRATQIQHLERADGRRLLTADGKATPDFLFLHHGFAL